MSNTIPATPDKPIKPTRYVREIIPIEDIIEYRNKGLSYQDIADLVGCSKPNVIERLQTCGYDPKRLKNFTKNRADMLAHLQSELLNSLTPEAINDIPAHHRMLAMGILYDKERLERGKSSQNISIVEITGSIQELQDQADKLRQSL